MLLGFHAGIRIVHVDQPPGSKPAWTAYQGRGERKQTGGNRWEGGKNPQNRLWGCWTSSVPSMFAPKFLFSCNMLCSWRHLCGTHNQGNYYKGTNLRELIFWLLNGTNILPLLWNRCNSSVDVGMAFGLTILLVTISGIHRQLKVSKCSQLVFSACLATWQAKNGLELVGCNYRLQQVVKGCKCFS